MEYIEYTLINSDLDYLRDNLHGAFIQTVKEFESCDIKNIIRYCEKNFQPSTKEANQDGSLFEIFEELWNTGSHAYYYLMYCKEGGKPELIEIAHRIVLVYFLRIVLWSDGQYNDYNGLAAGRLTLFLIDSSRYIAKDLAMVTRTLYPESEYSNDEEHCKVSCSIECSKYLNYLYKQWNILHFENSLGKHDKEFLDSPLFIHVDRLLGNPQLCKDVLPISKQYIETLYDIELEKLHSLIEQ